jgi:DNA-binding NtrC family response regulator
MPARVVVVLDEPGFAERVAQSLQRAGVDAAPLADPLVALDSLDRAQQIELLVTCADHGPGKPNGVSLALLAQQRRPNLKVIFVGEAHLAPFTAGLGAFMLSPVTVDEVVGAAIRTLESEPSPLEESGMPR